MLSSLQLRWLASVALTTVFGMTASVPCFGQGEAESLSASFRKASRRVLPAVVSVRAISAPSPLSGRPIPGVEEPGTPRRSGGSGLVIDAEKGYVLTNDHLVQGGSKVAVYLSNGRERIVSQIRRDPKSDLALLVIDGKGLSKADWGDSEVLDTGDWVLAIGQPYGLTDTVTAGIVSGKGRVIGLAMYEDFIQTDAAINHGNSGGPLVNMKGEVVGINTAIQTQFGGSDGVGFAIPSTRARRVAHDLAEFGRVRRAYLGMQIGAVDRATAERLEQPGAVRVNGLTAGGPAANAGLRRGDLLLKLQGKEVTGVGPIQAAIEIAKIGEPVTLTIERDGVHKEIKATPLEQPDTFGLPEESPPPRPRSIPGAGTAPEPAPKLPELEAANKLAEMILKLEDRLRKLEDGVRTTTEASKQPNSEIPADSSGSLAGLAAELERLKRRFGSKVREGDDWTKGEYSAMGLRLGGPYLELEKHRRYWEGPLVDLPIGLVIESVIPGSSAARAGLERGMILTDAAKRPIHDLWDFHSAITLENQPEPGSLLVRAYKRGHAKFYVLTGLPEHERNPRVWSRELEAQSAARQVT